MVLLWFENLHRKIIIQEGLHLINMIACRKYKQDIIVQCVAALLWKEMWDKIGIMIKDYMELENYHNLSYRSKMFHFSFHGDFGSTPHPRPKSESTSHPHEKRPKYLVLNPKKFSRRLRRRKIPPYTHSFAFYCIY